MKTLSKNSMDNSIIKLYKHIVYIVTCFYVELKSNNCYQNKIIDIDLFIYLWHVFIILNLIPIP